MDHQSVNCALRSARLEFLGVGIFSSLVNILALTGSFYMLQIYDRVLPSKSTPTLIGFTILLVLLYVAFAALDFARIRVLSRIGRGIDRLLRKQIFAGVLRSSQPRSAISALQSIRDLDQIRTFLSSLGPTAFFDLPWMPVYILLIFLLHPILGVFGLCGAIVLVALAAITEAKSRRPSTALAESYGARSAIGFAAQQNAELIRTMGLEKQITQRWLQATERMVGDQVALSDTAGGIGSISKVVRLLLQSGVLGLGAYLAIHDQLTAGSLIAASIILGRALAPIEIAIGSWRGFIGARQSMRRINAFLSSLPHLPRTMELPRPVKSLAVQKLVIFPPGNIVPALQNVSFALTAGDGLGIIGPSGSGKSTLVRAIVGGVPANSGDVRLDGATLDQWRPERLGRDIGYMPQDIELFAGSVAENIARLEPAPPSDKVLAAAHLAGLHEIIVGLPKGYETPVGPGGHMLPGGQRQLLALARALYDDPFLVVLDEPSSNLDSYGEAALLNASRSVRERGGIIVIVAHRPASVSGLNKILALAHGQVEAFGAADDILRSYLRPVRLVSDTQTVAAAGQSALGSDSSGAKS